MLRLFIPRAHTRNLLPAVRNTIIEPAFALAHKMHLSVDLFSIEWSQYHNLRSDERNPFAGEFNDFEFVDLLARGKTLKAPPSRNIEYLFDITPRLVFRRVKADIYAEPKVLKKPKILVAVTKEGHGHSKEPELHQGSDATALGWLYAHVKRGSSRR